MGNILPAKSSELDIPDTDLEQIPTIMQEQLPQPAPLCFDVHNQTTKEFHQSELSNSLITHVLHSAIFKSAFEPNSSISYTY